MNSAEHRLQFSKRLVQALHAADYSDSPTALSREFNARYSEDPVTPHSVRRWLIGEAIPSENKLIVLANCLGVTAAWLRFGGDDISNATAAVGNIAANRYAPEDIMLLLDIRQLNPVNKKIIQQLIHTMILVNASE